MRTTIPEWVRWVRFALTATAFAIGAGCTEKGPKFYPVAGKIVLESDGSVPKALVRQSIEFQSDTEPDTRAYGEIQPDGTFTLATTRQGRGAMGAIAGTHKGRIIVEIPQEEQAPTAKKRKDPVDFKFTRFETSPWSIQVPTTEPVILKVH